MTLKTGFVFHEVRPEQCALWTTRCRSCNRHHMDCHEEFCRFVVDQQPPKKSLRSYTSEERKAVPLWSFLSGYFPDAMMALTRLSKKANDKHNPGEPMHWARGKSADQMECAQRHLMTPYLVDPETGEEEIVGAAWRLLAEIQLREEARLKVAGIRPLSGIVP